MQPVINLWWASPPKKCSEVVTARCNRREASPDCTDGHQGAQHCADEEVTDDQGHGESLGRIEQRSDKGCDEEQKERRKAYGREPRVIVMKSATSLDTVVPRRVTADKSRSNTIPTVGIMVMRPKST